MFHLRRAPKNVPDTARPLKPLVSPSKAEENQISNYSAAQSKHSLSNASSQTKEKVDKVLPPPAEGKVVAKALQQQIEGEVRFDPGNRALYATDASNYRQVPVGVVIPKTAKDIKQTIAICRQYDVPIFSRGGGTSLAGQCCNVGVVMDMSKYYNRLLELNPEKRYAIVQPGLVLDSLRNEAEKHNLTFAPDPSTHNHCTLGGMIGNNSCGTHSVMGGTTADNLIEMEIALYDGTTMTVGEADEAEMQRIINEGGRKGEIYGQLVRFRDKYADLIRERFPKLKRRVSGYNLPALLPENGCNIAKVLAGSESTLVTVLKAKLNLIYSPPKRAMLVLGYPDVFVSGDHVPEIMKSQPTALEGLDHLLVDFMKEKNLHPQYAELLPEGGGFLVVEFGGATQEEADGKARALMEKLKGVENPPTMKFYEDREEEHVIWKVRESGLGATARIPGQRDTWEGWEDSAVPPEKLGQYLREMRKLLNKYNYKPVALYGHFGQGCVHCRIPFDLKTTEGIEHWRAFLDEAADLVVSFDGSISGEHGDGQSKADLLPKMFGDEMIKAFEEFKSIWDPDWKMNPGKIVRPNEITSNLRLGPAYSPWVPETHFKFLDDDNSFPRSTTRCVGVGECRRQEGGTMCPSYMATKEEMHSTRGRAHLLFEMLQGDVIKDGWRDKTTREALDLCLACKGCKSDCPVNVDMATLKAEFLSHYYHWRLRPRQAYAFGFIHIWARMAAMIPNLVNLLTQTPGLAALAKLAAGADQKTKIPKFAPQTFRQWFNKRAPRNLDKPAVLLFPDTFNDHFHPDTAIAAVEVLEEAGFQVLIPNKQICCGRPLYDYGLLNVAKRWLRQAIDVLKPYAEAGMPIIFLEPSCLAVFRDEMRLLFPADEDGHRIQNQSYPLSEFIASKAPDYEIPKLKRKVLLQVHCHHKSVVNKHDQVDLMKKMEAQVEMPEPGCCGMAGAFGFEEGSHYEVSKKIADLRLQPALDKLPDEQLIMADGFSCREQILQCSGREALHCAEVLKLAKSGCEPDSPFPEKTVKKPLPKRFTGAELALCGIFAIVSAACAWRCVRRAQGGTPGEPDRDQTSC